MLFANEKRIYLKQNLIFKFDISIVFADDHFANVLNRAALYIKVILTFPISKSADGFKVISQITMEKLLFVVIREND